MNLPPVEAELEPERYELFEAQTYRFELDRRDFLKALGGGIFVLFLTDASSGQQPQESPQRGGGRRRGAGGQAASQDIGAWLHVGQDGRITVYTGKAEVGQNIRTSLTQAVAEELPTRPDSVQLVMADTQLTPFDMGTFGSRTTPDMARRLRRIAAAARVMLIELAAERWNIDPSQLTARDGCVEHALTKRSLAYGKLTEGRKLTRVVADDFAIRKSDDWTVAGQSLAKVDGREFVTGKHVYTSDMTRPGMWYGKLLRPPSFGATLVSIDMTAARSIPDVAVVRDGDFVGVAAPTSEIASRAVRAIKAEWKPGPAVSQKDLFETWKQGGRAEREKSKSSAQRTGSINDGLKAADLRLESTYTLPYIAHAPLEPRAAVAEWTDGRVTVWTGTQRPFGVQRELATAFGVKENAVRVIVPDTGAAFGGKHSGEAAIEAARLAREAARPVKLVWSREEEFTWAYFRPAGLIEVKSGVRRDGRLTAWEFHNFNSGNSGIRTPYDVANPLVAFHGVRSPLRQGSYRALAATANHFARESHMDELAHELNLDPLELRLKNLKDDRMRDVLTAAARAFGWEKKAASGRGIGLAVGSEKGSYIATCAEVAVDVDSGRLEVLRAVSAFECGAVVNPDHLKNQVEGAMIMGLGGALFEAIEFDEGRILNPRFSRYRVPRFRDTPMIEVVLVDRKDLPSAGAGETPIVAIAPAIANAIFNATGTRIRSLPMALRPIRSADRHG